MVTKSHLYLCTLSVLGVYLSMVLVTRILCTYLPLGRYQVQVQMVFGVLFANKRLICT